MKNLESDNHFKAAEEHIAAGRHKEAWKELGNAQLKASQHAHSLSEGGNHQGSLAYRKIVLSRVGGLVDKMKNATEPVRKALELTEMQIAKAQALTFLWELMKKEGPGKYKYIIPQIELAHTPSDIKTIFALYGFQPIIKSDLMKSEKEFLMIGGHIINKPLTQSEQEERWKRILSASKDIEKRLGVKKREINR